MRRYCRLLTVARTSATAAGAAVARGASVQAVQQVFGGFEAAGAGLLCEMPGTRSRAQIGDANQQAGLEVRHEAILPVRSVFSLETSARLATWWLHDAKKKKARYRVDSGLSLPRLVPER